MASVASLCKSVLNVKYTVIENVEKYDGSDGVKCVRVYARVQKGYENMCSACSRIRLPRYDSLSGQYRVWRAVDWNGMRVEIRSRSHRVTCPEHGVIVARVPWAYPSSRFTKDFDRQVAWLSSELSRSAIAEFMRIDWHTVGQCISRVLTDIEPDRSVRFDNLVHIGIDETSYRKGHKYMTVIVNHDTNTVVWVADGHGKSVLERFFQSLTGEQRESIHCVTGDGARWITECVQEYVPHAQRCVDPFHVVQWAMDAIDQVRREKWQDARKETRRLETLYPLQNNTRVYSNPQDKEVLDAKNYAKEIKNARYALGKAPENLTAGQQARLRLIEIQDKELYQAYQFKESLRLLFTVSDLSEAENILNTWIDHATDSGIQAFSELAEKIKRHKNHILNTLKHRLSNARIEATNNKIKLIIRRAYGFRNLTNMMNMVYLVCSNLHIPLPNRKPIIPKTNKHKA